MKTAIDKILDRPIAFHRVFKTITGSTVAALMLSQAWYWSSRTSDSDGWFYKTQSEWEDETGLSRTEQETARKRLKELKILDEELRGVPARMYYRVNKESVYELLGIPQFAENLQTSLQETNKQDCGFPANINKNAETTAETTTGERRPKIKLPGNASIDWMIAGGVKPEEIQSVLEKEQRRAKVAGLWEELMKYNPLNWENDRVLKALLDFLVERPEEEIRRFAAWSKREYSTFDPVKARRFPREVIELWPTAMAWTPEKSQGGANGKPSRQMPAFIGDEVFSAGDADER